MVDDNSAIVRLRQAYFSWLVVLALVLSLLGGTAPAPTFFVTGSSNGLADVLAQDGVATLTSASKAARTIEHRSGHDPEDFAVPVSPTALPERVGTGDVPRTTAILRIYSSTGLPQSTAPPLT